MALASAGVTLSWAIEKDAMLEMNTHISANESVRLTNSILFVTWVGLCIKSLDERRGRYCEYQRSNLQWIESRIFDKLKELANRVRRRATSRHIRLRKQMNESVRNLCVSGAARTLSPSEPPKNVPLMGTEMTKTAKSACECSDNQIQTFFEHGLGCSTNV